MSISLVVLFGILTIFAIRKDGMTVWHAIVAVLFGLFLGATDAGPQIMDGTNNLLSWVGSLNF
ncbi:hypothetical protein SEA_MOAB_207 [Streptomyces phage Moab]|jgi:VanZ family protein|nr:hypothetical protein SEA_MOAB_207 [Streptomyces phage Moab]WMI33811.1 membrane protein [Streptomyces phage Patelgo]